MCNQRIDHDNFAVSNKSNLNQPPNYPIDSSGFTVLFFEPQNDDPDVITPNVLLHAPLLPKSPNQQILSPENNININSTQNSSKKILTDGVKSHQNYYPCLPSYIRETKLIADIALPMILTGLLVYSKSMISTIFLGRLGDLALAGGSLALGFANITGYSLLSGLAMGMEPICGQAYGAKKHALLGLTLHRTILLLLLASLPISVMWLNMGKILLLCRQDGAIAAQAQAYLLYSLPDLFAQSIIHPLRIYLRTQSITFPLTLSAALAIGLHLPINYLLVVRLRMGVKGVAVAGVITNFNMILFLVIYMMFSESCKRGWAPVGKESFRGFSKLLKLAIPSCISVCLEWWWYEIMILLCGLLPNPKLTVASMGILIQTTSLIYVFPSSLSVSVSTRVGNELGAGRPKRAKRAATIGLFFSFLLGFTALFFTVSVRKKWANLFTTDKDIVKLTALVLPVIGLCELGNCPQTTGCGVLRGTARPKVGANINLGCFYLVGMPVALWLGFVYGLGFRGLWFGLLAAQGSCVVAMLVVMCKTDWEVEVRRAQQLTDHHYQQQPDNQDENTYKCDSNPPLLV